VRRLAILWRVPNHRSFLVCSASILATLIEGCRITALSRLMRPSINRGHWFGWQSKHIAPHCHIIVVFDVANGFVAVVCIHVVGLLGSAESLFV
jgi:hypothetical protein